MIPPKATKKLIVIIVSSLLVRFSLSQICKSVTDTMGV